MIKMKTLCCVLTLTISATALQAQSPSKLPKGVAENYSTKTDYAVSDEFNGSKLNTKKWGRRNTGGYMIENFATDQSLVVMESERDSNGKEVKYVSIKGNSDGGKIKTAGIQTQSSAHFGFYVVRFRFMGLDTPAVKENHTIWHPSVWAANMNVTGKVKKRCGSSNWLEIDFVEWETEENGWSCDAPARLLDSKGERRKVVTQKGEGLEKAIVKDAVEDRNNEEWHTVGLEYSPDHLILWEWINGKWVNTSDRNVQFIDEDPACPEKSYTIGTIGKSAATPSFWLLGNVVSRYLYNVIEDGTSTYDQSDMSADFDFFRYYPHVTVKDTDWAWRNGVAPKK